MEALNQISFLLEDINGILDRIDLALSRKDFNIDYPMGLHAGKPLFLNGSRGYTQSFSESGYSDPFTTPGSRTGESPVKNSGLGAVKSFGSDNMTPNYSGLPLEEKVKNSKVNSFFKDISARQGAFGRVPAILISHENIEKNVPVKVSITPLVNSSNRNQNWNKPVAPGGMTAPMAKSPESKIMDDEDLNPNLKAINLESYGGEQLFDTAESITPLSQKRNSRSQLAVNSRVRAANAYDSIIDKEKSAEFALAGSLSQSISNRNKVQQSNSLVIESDLEGRLTDILRKVHDAII